MGFEPEPLGLLFRRPKFYLWNFKWSIFKFSCKAIFRCPKFEFRHLSYFLPVVGFEPEPLGLLYVGNSPRSGSILKYRHFTSHKVAGFCHRKFAAKRPKLLTCFCVSMIFSLSSSWMLYSEMMDTTATAISRPHTKQETIINCHHFQ